MLNSADDTLHKTCLLGLSYFNAHGEPLKQTTLAGRVVAIDTKVGIKIALFNLAVTNDNKKQSEFEHKTMAKSKLLQHNPNNTDDHFFIPADLSCWFTAPKGEFHTSQDKIKIINPDFLVTWNIYQIKKSDKSSIYNSPSDNDHQWWQWQPCKVAPKVK